MKKKEEKQGEDPKNSAGTEATRDTSALRKLDFNRGHGTNFPLTGRRE